MRLARAARIRGRFLLSPSGLEAFSRRHHRMNTCRLPSSRVRSGCRLQPEVMDAEGDVGDRPEAPEQDRHGEPLLAPAAILEGLPDAVVATGRDGRIVFVNALAEELFGYPREELLGQRVDVLWPERLRDR